MMENLHGAPQYIKFCGLWDFPSSPPQRDSSNTKPGDRVTLQISPLIYYTQLRRGARMNRMVMN